uniref:Uncharacterized protein n=1 Tax=Fervidicoccus fontis TaxID=683846 RepID=A0A7J3ZIH6_9CREN
MLGVLDATRPGGIEPPKIVLFVDWSEESNKAIRSVLEAKFIIETQSVLELAYDIVDVELTGLRPDARCPLTYFNNRIVLAGRAPTTEEILQLVLSWGMLAGEESTAPDLRCERAEPPAFGSAELLI